MCDDLLEVFGGEGVRKLHHLGGAVFQTRGVCGIAGVGASFVLVRQAGRRL